uniref:Uncharacterized protein n=1 Tax=Kalanchoe fedtschenkoi TaxID=63787 RepID=A0A7N0RBK3_KALFE
MFYSQFILAKKGPLGTIWIAAHLERKLRKNQVADTDIGVSVDSIIFPEVPIALRLSSHLLLGVVRIYSRKVNYLFDDCSEALLKIKQAFRSTAVDLPPEESTAPYHSITLPETFDLDDFELPDHDLFQGNYVDHHISNKDQITLQDTMDGVVYSTSQFGLDERFGDGDTSQIGLDLEEDLLLNKRTAPENAGDGMDLDACPTTSYHPDESIRDEKNVKMCETSEAMQTISRGPGVSATNQSNSVGNGNNELLEYAQAPGTPGLAEEPNLSNQKTSASDDHFEPENHLTESVTHENPTEILQSSPPRGHMAINHDLETICTEENGHISPEPNIKQSEPESNSNPETQDVALGMKKNPPDSSYCEDVKMGDNAPSPNIFGEDCDLRNSSDQPCPNAGDLSETSLLSNGCLLDGQETMHPEKLSNVVVAFHAKESLASKNVLESSELGSLDGTDNLQFLQVCNSYVKADDTLLKGNEDPCVDPSSECLETLDKGQDVQGDSVEVPEPQPTVILSRNFQVSDTIELVDEINQSAETCQQVQPNHSELNERTESSMPTPEKLLSVPEGHAKLPTDLLSETTPKKAPSTVDEDGTEVITGQKRSFTESILTVDSLHNGQSDVKDRLKKTAESVPDDEDLLSSILVGRRPSILKLRPTPPQTKVVSLKRPRTVSRSVTYKRKVLMDDSMVLHGDTIREQLMTTEDIRRVRKKAPCTRQEIWMIQKQFLEEDIVYDPISTGMSMELVCLHNQAYELSGISITKVQESVNQMDLTHETQPPQDKDIIPDIQECVGDEVNMETLLGTTSFQIENQRGEEGDISSVSLDNSEMQKGACVASLPPATSLEQGQVSEMGVDEQSDAVVEAVTHASSLPVETSPSTCLTVADVHETAADCAMPLPDETNDCSNVHYEASSLNQGHEGKVDHSHVATLNDGYGSPLHVESGLLNKLSVNEAENGGSVEDIEPSGPLTAPEIYKNDLGPGRDRTLENDDSNGAGPSFSVDHHINLVKSPSDGQNEIFNEFDEPTRQANGTTDADSAFNEDYTGMNYITADHDTGFLNVDDDDLEEDDSYVPSVEDSRTRIVDNSGWSSRTRAVSKYLQIMFDKEAERGKNVIPMDNLLTGKSRKEASRMFFETLVLKTRDYVQVEQTSPFDNINLRPQSTLMKSDF